MFKDYKGFHRPSVDVCFLNIPASGEGIGIFYPPRLFCAKSWLLEKRKRGLSSSSSHWGLGNNNPPPLPLPPPPPPPQHHFFPEGRSLLLRFLWSSCASPPSLLWLRLCAALTLFLEWKGGSVIIGRISEIVEFPFTRPEAENALEKKVASHERQRLRVNFGSKANGNELFFQSLNNCSSSVGSRFEEVVNVFYSNSGKRANSSSRHSFATWLTLCILDLRGHFCLNLRSTVATGLDEDPDPKLTNPILLPLSMHTKRQVERAQKDFRKDGGYIFS